MTAITTTYRSTLATALASVTSNVYPQAPPAPVPPALVITADDPWQVPAVLGGRLRTEVRYRVLCLVQDRGDNLAALETLVENALVALPAGVQLDQVTAPTSLDNGAQGSLLVSEIRLTVHLKES
jgi:hypothetical protein